MCDGHILHVMTIVAVTVTGSHDIEKDIEGF